MKTSHAVAVTVVGMLLIGAPCWILVTRAQEPKREIDVRPNQLGTESPTHSSIEPRGVASAGTTDFASRLDAADTISDRTERRLARATALTAWLNADFPAAFAMLRSEKFASLLLPSVAQLVGTRATVDQLVIVAEESALTFDALQTLSPFLDGTTLRDLAAASERIQPAKQTDAAAAIATALAIRNVDAALRYAEGIPPDTVRAAAYAAVADSLTTRNAASDARTLLEALPPALRDQDAIRFALGNALRDSAPEQALASYRAIADPQQRKLALVGFSRSIESRAPGAALQAIFVAELSPDGAMNHARRILSSWGTLDHPAAVEFVETSAAPPEAQRRALREHLSSLARP